MHVQPWPLTQEAKDALDPSMGTVTWGEVESWIADRVACVWRIGAEAWALTFANENDEIEIVACGGKGAWRAAKPFERAMRALPEHQGMTLCIPQGRAGWKRLYPHWNYNDGVLSTRI